MNFDEIKSVPTSVMSDITDSEMFSDLRTAKPVAETEFSSPVDTEQANEFKHHYQPRGHDDNAPIGAPYLGNAEETDVNFGELINGEMVTELWDSVAPVLMVYAAKSLLKIAADKRQFGLTKKEKDLLSPIVQKCLDFSQIKFDNPWSALTFAIIFIYGSKFADMAANKQPVGADKPATGAKRGRPFKSKAESQQG